MIAAAIFNSNRTKATDRVWQPIDFVRSRRQKEMTLDEMRRVMDRLGGFAPEE